MNQGPTSDPPSASPEETGGAAPKGAFLSYVDRLAPRPLDSITTVVIHCTELPDMAMARDYGEVIHHPGSRTGNSGHFYVDRDGRLEQWVPLDRVAHHVRGHNEHSIGIELVNLGRYPHWLSSTEQTMQEPYAETQITALLALLDQLTSGLLGSLPGLRYITGHEDLDLEAVPASDNPALTVRRKQDPGALFPWPRVMDSCSLVRPPNTGVRS